MDVSSSSVVRSVALAALLAFAGPAGGETFTNEDLESEPDTSARIYTNADLQEAEGNVTFTNPEDDVSYENLVPIEQRRDPHRDRSVARLKQRYQELRRQEERIQEELPDARDAAERELGTRIVIVNGVPTRVSGPIDRLTTPARYRLQQLERELARVQEELYEIEREAKQYDLGRPGLMKK